MQKVIVEALTTSAVNNASNSFEILAFGLLPTATDYYCGTDLPLAYQAFLYWVSLAEEALGWTIRYDIVNDAVNASSRVLSEYSMIYIPSQKAVSQCSANDTGGFDFTLCDIESALTARKADIEQYINEFGGSIVALQQSVNP